MEGMIHTGGDKNLHLLYSSPSASIFFTVPSLRLYTPT